MTRAQARWRRLCNSEGVEQSIRGWGESVEMTRAMKSMVAVMLAKARSMRSRPFRRWRKVIMPQSSSQK